MGWYGNFGIKLTSYDDSKRQWLFRARSDPEQSEWLEVLMNACKKAKPEPLKDPVYTATFKAAFSATKAAYGYFGVCFIFGTECEMLEHLTNQILSREILDDLIIERAKAQPAHAKTMVLEVHRHVQKIVKPIVQHSWDNCFSAVRVLKAPFELSVKASLRQLVQKETDIKAHLDAKIRQIVLPHLGEIESTICTPILTSCVEPMLQAYEQAVEGLQVEIFTLIDAVEPYADSVRASQTALMLSVEQGMSTANCLSASQKLLWTMHTEDLIDLQDIFEISGLAGFDVYSNALDDLKLLTVNAIFTFGNTAIPVPADKNSPNGSRANSPTPDAKIAALQEGDATDAKDAKDVENEKGDKRKSKGHKTHSPTEQEGGSSGPSSENDSPMGRTHSRSHSKSRTRSKHRSHSSAHHSRVVVSKTSLVQCLNQVVVKMCADGVLSLRAGLKRLLLEAMEAKVQECMISPCGDEVGSAKAHITRDMQLMLNLHSIGESMVRDMVSDFVDTLISKNMKEASSRLQDISDRLCCAHPTPANELF